MDYTFDTMEQHEEKISECPVCSGVEHATGRQEVRDDGKTYFEFTCDDCGLTGFEWKAQWEEEKHEA